MLAKWELVSLSLPPSRRPLSVAKTAGLHYAEGRGSEFPSLGRCCLLKGPGAGYFGSATEHLNAACTCGWRGSLIMDSFTVGCCNGMTGKAELEKVEEDLVF